MEEMILNYLASLNPIALAVLSGLGILVVGAQAFVAVTPSPNDDAFLNKLYEIPVLGKVLLALRKFAPVQKK